MVFYVDDRAALLQLPSAVYAAAFELRYSHDAAARSSVSVLRNAAGYFLEHGKSRRKQNARGAGPDA